MREWSRVSAKRNRAADARPGGARLVRRAQSRPRDELDDAGFKAHPREHRVVAGARRRDLVRARQRPVPDIDAAELERALTEFAAPAAADIVARRPPHKMGSDPIC